MNKLKILMLMTAITGLSNQALAVSVQDLTDACVAQGEEKAVCKCSAVKWSRTITASEKSSAQSMVAMMVENKPPSPSARAQIQPLLSRYQKIGMDCAMNASYEEENTVDLSDFIPKGAMSDEDMRDLNAIMKGDGTNTMEKLKSMDDRNAQRKEKLKQEKQAETRKRDSEIESLRKRMKAEQARLEQQPILSRKVSDFESLTRMRTELYGDGTEDADCLWNTLEKEAGSDESGVLAAYFVAIGGGDFDQPPEHKPYMREAQEKFQSYMAARESCY